MKFLPLILKNLTRNKRRTILTLLSIAISLFIFALLVSLPSVVNEILRDRANSLRLICHSKGGFFYTLPEAYLRRIRSIPSVQAVMGENLFMGTYRDPHDQIPSAAIDPEQVNEVWSDFGISAREAGEFNRLRSAAIVGEMLMTRYGWKLGQQIILRGTIYPVDVQLTIIGTLGDRAPGYALIFRRDYLSEVLHGLDDVNLFWIKVDSSKSIPRVIAQVDETFANSPAETETESELAASQAGMANLRVLFDGVKVLAAIVLVAIALVAANTAAMSIRERRPEIAVMRAIGFSRKLLLACLIAEGMVIGLVAGILGCAIAWIALRLIPYASATLGPIALILSLPPRIVVTSLVAAVAIGLASSAVPAYSATARRIADTMRAVA
jgi:putative ABC transport system permease protein